MNISLKIDIPTLDEQTSFAIFEYNNFIELCKQTLKALPDWNFILERRLAEGAKLELAWRVDTELDWIWWLDAVSGSPREWAVLSGLALNQVRQDLKNSS